MWPVNIRLPCFCSLTQIQAYTARIEFQKSNETLTIFKDLHLQSPVLMTVTQILVMKRFIRAATGHLGSGVSFENLEFLAAALIMWCTTSTLTRLAMTATGGGASETRVTLPSSG